MSVDKDELLAVYTSMAEYSKKMQDENEFGVKIARKTSLFIRVVVIILVFGSLFVSYKGTDLAKSIYYLSTSLEAMYVNFGKMTKDIESINADVKKMSNHVQAMPRLSGNMNYMSSNVNSITNNVVMMDNNFILIEEKMKNTSINVHNINKNFKQVNASVNHIQSNTKKIALPMRDMKKMFPFMP